VASLYRLLKTVMIYGNISYILEVHVQLAVVFRGLCIIMTIYDNLSLLKLGLGPLDIKPSGIPNV